MSEPKRWSENGSEVDAVLRSVVRYGQRQAPTPEQLQRILRGAAAARPVPRRPARAFFVAVASGLAAALGGLSWAQYGLPDPPPASERDAPLVSPPPPKPAPPAARVAPPLASATPAVEPPATSAPAPSGRSPTVSTTLSAAPPASDQRDAALLQQARSALVNEPQRALTLLRDHAVHFPSSALGEERSALQIEALVRLGRGDEARQRWDAFESHFPRSPYRRRLRALLATAP